MPTPVSTSSSYSWRVSHVSTSFPFTSHFFSLPDNLDNSTARKDPHCSWQTQTQAIFLTHQLLCCLGLLPKTVPCQ